MRVVSQRDLQASRLRRAHAHHSKNESVVANSRQRRVHLEMFDIEDFILAVKQRPALYNPTHHFYNRKDVRAQLWTEIGALIYSDWDRLSSQEKTEKGSFLQKKWKSLKDCFNREVRLQKMDDSGKQRKKYEFYKQLSFLHLKNNPEDIKPHTAGHEPRAKLDTINKSECQTPNQPGSNQNPTENPRKRKPVQSQLESLKRVKAKVSRDGDRLFLLSFVDDLKKLPLASKYWVKMKFTEVMHQAAMSLAQEFEGASIECEDGSPDYEEYDEINSQDSSLSGVFVCKTDEEMDKEE